MTGIQLGSDLDLNVLNREVKFWIAQNPNTKKYISVRKNGFLAVFKSYQKASEWSIVSDIMKNAIIFPETFDNIQKIAFNFFEGKYEIID